MITNPKIKNKLAGAFGYFRRHWLSISVIFLVVLFGYPIYKRWRVRQDVKDNSNQAQADAQNQFIDNQNPASATFTANQITTRKDIQTASTAIAAAFKTKWAGNTYLGFLPWQLAPGNWFENELTAYSYLLQQRNNFYLVSKLYYYVDTPRRNLKDDILAYLTDDQINHLQSLNVI